MSLENLTEHEQLFYTEGFKLGSEAAWVIADEQAYLDRITSMYAQIDGLIESILNMARSQQVPVDCRKGCSFCCYQAVFANSYELHYLSKFLKKTFPHQQVEAVRLKAIEKNEKVSVMSNDRQLNYKSPCPLLADGACSAYAARPMACRIYLSMSLNSCREFFEHPENESSFAQLLEFPLMAGRMMNEGFAAALHEKGIDIAEFRMEEGLASALTFGVNR